MPLSYTDIAAISALIVAIGGVLTNLYAKRQDALIAAGKSQADARTALATVGGQVEIKELDVGEMVRRDLIDRVASLEERDRKCQEDMAALREQCLKEIGALSEKYLRARHYLWQLTTTMRSNGMVVNIPHDLELDDLINPSTGAST